MIDRPTSARSRRSAAPRPTSAGPAREDLERRHGAGAWHGDRPASARRDYERWSIPRGDGRPGYQWVPDVSTQDLRGQEEAALRAVSCLDWEMQTVQQALEVATGRMQTILSVKGAAKKLDKQAKPITASNEPRELYERSPSRLADSPEDDAETVPSVGCHGDEPPSGLTPSGSEVPLGSSSPLRSKNERLWIQEGNPADHSDTCYSFWWKDGDAGGAQQAESGAGPRESEDNGRATGEQSGSAKSGRRTRERAKPWPPPAPTARASLDFATWQQRERLAEAHRISMAAHGKAKELKLRARVLFQQKMRNMNWDPVGAFDLPRGVVDRVRFTGEKEAVQRESSSSSAESSGAAASPKSSSHGTPAAGRGKTRRLAVSASQTKW